MSDVTVRDGRVIIRPRGVTRTITVSRETVARINANRPAVQVHGTPRVVIDSGSPTVNVGSGMGLQGPPGEDGADGTDGGRFAATVGAEAVVSLRMVRAVNGLLLPVDIDIDAHASQVVGLATQSGSPGEQVLVRNAGEFEEQNWDWDPGFVWIGAQGLLTQTPPSTGWLMVAGRVLSPTKVLMDIEEPIFRS